MGDMGLTHKGPWLLEGLINVPMIWRVPGGRAGGRADGLFSSCDIAPTILSLLGADLPRAMDGIAQADLVRAGTGRREAAFVEYRTPQGDNLRTVVTPDWKLTYYAGKEYGELYDMARDPPEARNLHADPACAPRRGELEKRLLDELVLREDYRLHPTAGA
jgi:arylsulfatase A-like enzyme